MWSLLWHRPFSDFLNFRTATSFEFGNGKDALQPKTISTKWYGNIPDSPDWVPGNVWKRNIRWFWDLDHHGEIASRKKIPTLRTGLKGGPRPSSRPFFREGFQIQFSPFGKFRTGRAIFFRPTPKCFADRFTEVGVGVKWLGGGRLGKMAARSDAARQTPPGHPGLQHTLEL